MGALSGLAAVGAAYAAPSRGARGRLLQASGARCLTVMPAAPVPCCHRVSVGELLRVFNGGVRRQLRALLRAALSTLREHGTSRSLYEYYFASADLCRPERNVLHPVNPSSPVVSAYRPSVRARHEQVS